MPTRQQADASARALARVREIPLGQASLFLDLDGTLATFRDTPSEVGPERRRTALLRRLNALLEGRMAIVSGRTVAEIDRIVETPFAAAGTHGLERRGVTGELTAAEPHPELERARAEVAAFAGDRPGLLVEDKSLSVGLHYRGAPALQGEVTAFAETLAERSGLFLQRGDRVVELRTPGANKGDAVGAFMGEAPYVNAIPIFLGDDVTDEDAFAAVADLGGLGVLVGPPRETRATARLADVEEVLTWLERSARSGVFSIEVDP